MLNCTCQKFLFAKSKLQNEPLTKLPPRVCSTFLFYSFCLTSGKVICKTATVDDPLPWIVHMFFLSWVLNSHCFLAYHEIQVRIYKRALQESEELKELQGKLPQWRWQSLKGCSRQKCAACAKYEMGCDREQEQRLGNVFMLWTRMLRPKVRRNHCGKENEINRLACGNAYSQIHHIHRYAFSRDPVIYTEYTWMLYYSYIPTSILPIRIWCLQSSLKWHLVIATKSSYWATVITTKWRLPSWCENAWSFSIATCCAQSRRTYILGMASESRHKCPGWFILCPEWFGLKGDVPS